MGEGRTNLSMVMQAYEKKRRVSACYQQVDAHMIQHLQDAGCCRCSGQNKSRGGVKLRE